jgi:hypothetical protein
MLSLLLMSWHIYCMTRLTEGMGVLRGLRERPDTGVAIGNFIASPMPDGIVAHEWWQSIDGRIFFPASDRLTLERHNRKKSVAKASPINGKATRPIEVDDELLILRRLHPVHAVGSMVTQLVGVDTNDMFSVVGSKRIYGSVEHSGQYPKLELPGGQPITEEVARSFTVVLNELAPEIGFKKVQLGYLKKSSM